MQGESFVKRPLEKPDGVFWKETDYHKQKKLEDKNPIFKKKGGRR